MTKIKEMQRKSHQFDKMHEMVAKKSSFFQLFNFFSLFIRRERKKNINSKLCPWMFPCMRSINGAILAPFRSFSYQREMQRTKRDFY